MSRILVDTSAYSGALRGNARLEHSLQEADEICVSPVVLGELKAGFTRGRHREKNERELAEFLASPRVRIVEIDEGTSDRYALILDSLRSAGTPIPTNDIWISSSAMEHGLQVVTTDEHFRKVPQILVDWFAESGT